MKILRNILAAILLLAGVITALYPVGFFEKLSERYPLDVDQSMLAAKFYGRGYEDKLFLSAISVVMFLLAFALKKTGEARSVKKNTPKHTADDS